jgi:hypothetical protein
VHDQVDAGRDRRDDERRADVLAGQQRQGAHLHHGLAGAVRVQGAHAGQTAVECDEQVEALLLAHLADDDPRGPHAQRLLDETAQRDLTGALEVGLPGLHRHHVGERHAQLEHLLAGDHPLPRRDGRAQAVQQSRLAGLGAAGDEDVQAGRDRRLQEARRLRGQRAQRDELVERVRLQHELADVDRHVPARDVGDDHVQP